VKEDAKPKTTSQKPASVGHSSAGGMKTKGKEPAFREQVAPEEPLSPTGESLRTFLATGLRSGPGAFFAALVTGCSTDTKFTGVAPTPVPAATVAAASADQSALPITPSTTTTTPVTSLEGELSCEDFVSKKVEVKEIPDARAELIPRVKFWGNPKSTMMAFAWSQSSQAASFTVARQDGTKIAFGWIQPSHHRTDGSMRPVVIDNIDLSNLAIVVIHFKTRAGLEFKHRVDITYERMFMGLRVEESRTGEFFKHALTDPAWQLAVAPQFDAPFASALTNGFREDASVSFPMPDGTAGARSLLTATDSAVWSTHGMTLAPGDKVTDVLGDEIDLTSGNFILETQTFFVYRKNGETSWIKTSVKVG
jgi:hypothetical protein